MEGKHPMQVILDYIDAHTSGYLSVEQLAAAAHKGLLGAGYRRGSRTTGDGIRICRLANRCNYNMPQELQHPIQACD